MKYDFFYKFKFMNKLCGSFFFLLAFLKDDF